MFFLLLSQLFSYRAFLITTIESVEIQLHKLLKIIDSQL